MTPSAPSLEQIPGGPWPSGRRFKVRKWAFSTHKFWVLLKGLLLHWAWGLWACRRCLWKMVSRFATGFVGFLVARPVFRARCFGGSLWGSHILFLREKLRVGFEFALWIASFHDSCAEIRNHGAGGFWAVVSKSFLKESHGKYFRLAVHMVSCSFPSSFS